MLRKQTSDKNPADWFDLAEDRLKVADLAWKYEGITAAGIECLQEAAERYLKGFLIAKGWKLEKTHDLARLVGDAVTYHKSFTAFSALAIALTEEFFAQHYPGGDMTTLGANYETMRAAVGDLVELIKKSVPQHFPK
jgi:HEPN domain-containing protein